MRCLERQPRSRAALVRPTRGDALPASIDAGAPCDARRRGRPSTSSTADADRRAACGADPRRSPATIAARTPPLRRPADRGSRRSAATCAEPRSALVGARPDRPAASRPRRPGVRAWTSCAWSPHLTEERRGRGAGRRVALERTDGRSSDGQLHVVLADATRGIVGRDELAAMKPSAYLAAPARPALVDTDAAGGRRSSAGPDRRRRPRRVRRRAGRRPRRPAERAWTRVSPRRTSGT